MSNGLDIPFRQQNLVSVRPVALNYGPEFVQLGKLGSMHLEAGFVFTDQNLNDPTGVQSTY